MESLEQNRASGQRPAAWREYVVAWLTVSVLAGAVEARWALVGRSDLLSPGEQRGTFLWAVLIQLVVLGVSGGALETLLRLMKYPPRRWRTALPGFLTFTANAAAVAVFLPVGLFVNVRYLGSAFEIASLLGTLGVFLACLLVLHLLIALLGRLIATFYQDKGSRLYRLVALGVILVCLVQGLAFVKKPRTQGVMPPARPDAPNLVILTLDTTRADHVLPHENQGRQLCPLLNQFFADATVFHRAYVPIPNTVASHATIFTGLYPSSHGVRSNRHRLDDSVATLAEVLREQGYQTAAFVSSLVLEPGNSGIHRGFERYDHNVFQRADVPFPVTRLTVVRLLSGLGAFHLLARDARAVTDSALGWLRRVQGPFFLWVHYWDPHRPYAPPQPYAAQHDPDYGGPLPLDTYGLMHRPDAYWQGRERDAEHLRRLYAAEVQFMDSQIGRLFESLQRKGLLASTAVLAVADHGEALGETGRFFKHSTLYEFDVRVPLYLKIPSSLAQQKAVQPGRIDAVVESVDILPTLLELLGLKAQVAYPFQGRSLLPLLQGEKQEGPKRAFLECADWRGLSGARWKWIAEDDGRQRLFDLSADPQEQHDVSAASPELAATLEAEYEKRLGAVRSVQFDSEAVTDSETLKQLEQLGYLAR